MNSITSFTHKYLPLGDEYTKPGASIQPNLYPNVDEMLRFENTSHEIVETIHDLMMYTMDFQTEMANLLLGGFIGRSIPRRSPIDQNVIVLSLEHSDELCSYFNEQTAWGKEMKKFQDQARQ